MRQIEFGGLWIENFKAISHPVHITIDTFQAGCHAVRGVNKYKPRLGSNGVSKSSIWDALCFALYGKTPKGQRGPTLVPWGQKVSPMVIVRFYIDGETYLVKRTASPHKLVVNDTPVEQAYLDNLLGIPFAIFCNTVLLAQGQDLFLDMTPTAKLNMLTEILMLERWDTYAADAHQHVADLNDQISEVLSREETYISGQIEATTGEIARLIIASDDFAKHHDEEVMALTLELAGAKDEHAKAEGVVHAATKAMGDYKAKCEQLERAVIVANVARKDIEVLHARSKHLMDHTAFLKTHEECPTCGQSIGAKHRHYTIREIEAELAKLPPMAPVIQAANKATKAHADYEAANRNTTEKYYQATTHALHTKRKLENAQKRLASAQHANDPHASGLSVASIKLKGLKKSLGVARAKLDAAEAERQGYRTWMDGFKTIKLLQVEDFLDTLSLLTSAYASQLGLECTARFSVEREGTRGTTVRGINLTVDGITDFEAWSVGEGQRLRLATSMALAHVLLESIGVSIPLRILDEPSAHLSPEGLKELAAFLDQHGRDENMAIFLTDQRAVSGVTSTITLTRTAAGVELTT